MKRIVVLGAGILGVSTAWFLQKNGYQVTVIDRQSGAAQETSFANGCQISVSHAEPWANPSAPWKILKWLGKEDAPLLYKFQNDPNQWKWCLQFLRECTPKRTAANIKQIVNLCEYSRKTLGEIRAETNIQYDQLVRGILHFYTEEKEFKNSLEAAQLMRELGCPRNSVSAEKVVEIEPALIGIKSQIVGGDFTDNDESGDVYKFTSGLAKLAEEAGVEFLYNTTITKLIQDANELIKSVEVIDSTGHHKEIDGSEFVVCMGSFSPMIVKPLGIKLLIYPGKGYSATYNIIDESKTPTVSLTDDQYKLVFSHLGNRLRVAGTCELNGYNRDLNKIRCEAITRRAKELFPGACDYDHPTYWTGLRPLTPSNVPYVGQSKIINLYLATGTGTLGWTMGTGIGKSIADIISNGSSELDFAFTRDTFTNF